MLAFRGGFTGCPEPIQRTLTFFAYMYSVITRTPPQFSLPPTSGSITVASQLFLDCPPEPSLRRFASSLFDTRQAKVLGPALISITVDIREIVLLREIYRGSPTAQPADVEVDYIHGRARSVDHRLLKLPFTNSGNNLTAQQETIRIGLYFIIHWDRRELKSTSSSLCRSLTFQLQSALQQTNLESGWAPNCDILAWLLLVGSHISCDQKERPWFILHFARIVRNLQLQDPTQMREIFLGFPYLDRVFKKSLVKIWEEVKLVEQDLPTRVEMR
jgi:hypothetical protein